MSSREQTKTGGRPATTGVIPGLYALSVGKPDLALPEDWKWTALSDVARLETGHTPSRKHPEYWGGDVSWIGIKDATENHGRMILDTYQHTNELGIENSSARILPKNTVCLSRTASVGYVVVMGKPMATSQDFVNWVCSDKIDYRFLKYVLLGEHETLLRFASGTTHQTIYFPEAKAFHVALPPRKEQEAIAEVLSVLDDKIELNRRMNETLEATARALFKSWFIDFDPVYAKIEKRETTLSGPIFDLFPATLIESELGEIPQGWKQSRLGEHIVNFDSRRVPLSGAERSRRPGPYRYYGAAGILDHVNDFLFEGTHVLVGEDGSVMRSGGVAVTQYVSGKFWVNNHAHVLRGKNSVSTEQLLLYFEFQPVAPYVTGAVQPKLSQGRMNLMPFLFAGEPVCHAFGKNVSPYFQKVLANEESNRTLATLRDTLLPKLISGEIRVKDAEKLAEAVA
jgi:type I restriction enzyme S subunit